MKCIVLFGAGKSSTILIEYLKENAVPHNWQVIVADASFEAALHKTGTHPNVTPLGADVYNDEERAALVQKADVIISLLPPSLHIPVAKDCVTYGSHLLTASYIDDGIRALQKDVESRGLLFLCEMGLDPGIDHMSAMQMIHRIQEKGGVITSFKSHCGGLVAPESDNNPWHYKISWNPRNVAMAGKAGASFKENNIIKKLGYTNVFSSSSESVTAPDKTEYAWYPNRDSLPYVELYKLQAASTFLRTTLRHKDFIAGWRNIIALEFTNESFFYDTDDLTITGFFKEHIGKVDYAGWLEKETLAGRANTSKKQLNFLFTDETPINKGVCSAADILQFVLETKLALQLHDKDMIVMLHEVEYMLAKQLHKATSYLVVKGDNNSRTAMAKTVGLPLGIAAKLLLESHLTERGLHIPIIPSLYQPVLAELGNRGIIFSESDTRINLTNSKFSQ